MVLVGGTVFFYLTGKFDGTSLLNKKRCVAMMRTRAKRAGVNHFLLLDYFF